MARFAFGFVCLAWLVAGVFGGVWPAAAQSARFELVMVESAGCPWCARWNAEIGGIYANTEEGAQAPLRRVDIHDPIEREISLVRPVRYTPTFLLVRGAQEIGRIEGYPGEHFFWPMLGQLLSAADESKKDKGNGAMKKQLAAAVLTAATLAAGGAGAQDDGLVEMKAMSLDTAMALAQGALANCREGGYQVGVAVVDRSGLTQVVLRDRYAGPHTLDTATRKAWTAVSFRTDTVALTEMVAAEPRMAGIPDVTNALVLGGGVPVEAAGAIIGGVGVSGAPDPEIDDACARAGIEAVQDILDF